MDSIVFALAFYVNNALKGRGFSDFNASIAAGAFTVPFVTIGEGMTANRQVNGKPYSEIFRRALRPAGLIATVGREVPFTVGVFYLSPLLQKQIQQRLPESGVSTSVALLTQGIAGAVSGAIVGYATVPVDLIKTRIQTHEQTLSIGTVVRSAIADRGWRGIWRGGDARSIYIALTGAGMNMVQHTLPAYLPKAFHVEE